MKPIELLQKNRTLLLTMKELAAKQERLVLNDEMNAFLELVTQRERLQSKISTIEMKYRELTGKNQIMDEEVRSLSKEMLDTLNFIQESDKRIEKLLVKEKASLFFEMKNLRESQKAVRGYGGSTGKDPRFIDREG